MWITTFEGIEMYNIIIIFYFVVIFNSYMRTFKFDVHRHHHHLFWKCIFLPGDSGVRRLPIWFHSIYPLNFRQQKHPKAWNLRVYEPGRTFERWRKSGYSCRTNSFESCLKVIREPFCTQLLGVRLSYQNHKFISHASYHHQSLAVMLWWRIAGNQRIGVGWWMITKVSMMHWHVAYTGT